MLFGLLGVAVPLGLSAPGCGKVAPDCTAAELACGGSCIDPTNDNANCGMCGRACDQGLVCGNGQCAAACPSGQETCDSTCVDTQTDSTHCGDCTTTCAADQECRAGSCQLRCDVMLTAPVTDPWGFEWDGLERTASALDVATTTCAAFGGRLPSATELYRVSANQSGAVGQSFHTNYLWSTAPANHLDQATVRLSDATVTSTPATSALTYRCVCAPPQPAFFGASRCSGPAGGECFTLGKVNIDRSDRPAMRRSSAVAECAAEHAHLADLPQLVEGVFAGLPGSGAAIATADSARYDLSTTLKWTTATGWTLAANTGYVGLSALAPFRCAGPGYVSGTHPVTVPNEYVAAGGIYKSEMTDSAVLSWPAAHDACFSRGGHLPRATELAELIGQGLPNGTNTYLYTSDVNGHNGTQFLSEVEKWVGLDKRFSYEYTGAATQTATWDYKTTPQAYRCIYYPIDPTYVAPTSCNGNCFALAPGTGPARMTFDGTDRPAQLPGDAADTCRKAGGHLPSERDYTEAIRGGLPNGTGAQLLTSDQGIGNVAVGNVTVVYWSSVDTTFDDQYPAHSTWVNPATSAPFRCMWTNELR